MAQPMKKEAIKKAVSKQLPAKKQPVKKAVAKIIQGKNVAPQFNAKLVNVTTNAPKKAAAKKVVIKTFTLEQRLKRAEGDFVQLSNDYQALAKQYCGLKNSFAMLKENHEREKNRLDKVIDTALNNSKTK